MVKTDLVFYNLKVQIELKIGKLELLKLELFWNLNKWGDRWDLDCSSSFTNVFCLSLSFFLSPVFFFKILSTSFFLYFFTTVLSSSIWMAHTGAFSSSISQISHGCISKIRPGFSSLNLWVLFGLFGCDFWNK